MSPPRGGDSWKWSETENQSKPMVSANFHSLRISSSGPPMWPTWMPKVIGMAAPSGLEVRVDLGVDQVRAAARQRPTHGRADLARLLHALAGDPERAGQLDVVHVRALDVHADVEVVLGREALQRQRALL